MNEAMLSVVREKVASMFNEAFPGSDRNDAWAWRVKNIGKADTKDWSHGDWVRAHEKLREKLGIPARPRRTDSSLDLGL